MKIVLLSKAKTCFKKVLAKNLLNAKQTKIAALVGENVYLV